MYNYFTGNTPHKTSTFTSSMVFTPSIQLNSKTLFKDGDPVSFVLLHVMFVIEAVFELIFICIMLCM